MKSLLLIILTLIQINNSVASVKCDMDINTELCISLTWLEGPNVDAYSKLRLVYFDKEDMSEVDRDVPKIYPWMIMDGHEHGSMDVLIERKNRGTFIISEIFFFSGMQGQWVLKLDDEIVFEL